jgi:hypothetical protein
VVVITPGMERRSPLRGHVWGDARLHGSPLHDDCQLADDRHVGKMVFDALALTGFLFLAKNVWARTKTTKAHVSS